MDKSYELALASLRLVVENAHPRTRGKLTTLETWPTHILSTRSSSLRTREMVRQFDSATDRVSFEIAVVNSSAMDNGSDDDQYNLALASIAKELDNSAHTILSEIDFTPSLRAI